MEKVTEQEEVRKEGRKGEGEMKGIREGKCSPITDIYMFLNLPQGLLGTGVFHLHNCSADSFYPSLTTDLLLSASLCLSSSNLLRISCKRL